MNNLQQPIVTAEFILNYIPQRLPIVLVSKIYNCNEKVIITGFDVESDHIFVRNNKLTESGIIENMAQSAACMAGFEAVKNNVKPVVGFIGNIKNLSINFLPETNTEIITEVVTKTKVLNVSIVEAKSYNKNELVATCELKIFLQENT